MKTHLPVALRKALIAAIFAVSAFAYNKASAETESPSVGGTTALEVTVTGNNETHSHSGDINVAPMDSVAGYDALKITAGDKANGVSGSITVESAPTTLYNADFSAEGDITIGGDNNKSQMLVIRGSGSTEIEATGDIYFKLRVDAAVGQDQNTGNETSGGREERGSMRIHADGDIVFDSVTPGDALNRQVRFAGGETDNDTAVLSAGGSIKVKDMGSCTLAWTRNSVVTSGKDITITLPYSDGLFSGAVNAGTTFSFGGANFSIYDVRDEAPTLTAGEGISVATTGMNYGYNAIMTATTGDITLVSSSSSSISNIYYSVTATAKDGDISVQSVNGRAYMQDCAVESETGDISVTGKKVEADETSYKAENHLTLAGTSLTGLADVAAEADSMKIGTETGDTNITSKSELDNVHSSFTATGNIEVNGSRVNISDATTIRSEDGSVSIAASGEYAEDPKTQRPFGGVNIRESEVEAQGDISITGASVTMTDALAVSRGKNTIGGSVETSLMGVVVDGGSLAIGKSTGTTTLGSSTDAGAVTAHTTLDAMGKIAVTGKTVSIADVSVDSTGTDADGVSVAITGSDVEVSGENVTGTGSVTIAGTTSTEVNGVAISGAGISLGSETGTTTITNTDDKDTTLDATGKIAVTGTTVSLTDISVDSTGTDADGVSVAITGSDVEVSGENVTGTGSVTIAGTTGTKVNGVDVDGASISVGSETGTTTITNTDDKDTTLDATGKIAVTGTTVSLTDISVDSTGTDANGVSVAITGSDVKVSGENVTGTGSVTISGTTGTKVNGVDVDGASIAVGSETGATTITNTDDKDTTLDATGKIAVTGTTVSLTDISVDCAGTDADGVSVAITGGDVEVSGENVTGTGAVNIVGTTSSTLENVVVSGQTASITGDEVSVTGESVTGTDSVTIAGTTSTTIENVNVKESATATIGSDTATGQTSLSNSGVVVEGEVAIAGGSVNITGNEGISSETGSVKVTATAGAASIAGGAVTAEAGAVEVSGASQTTLDNVAVDGNTVSLGNVDSVTTITGGTVDGDGDVSVYGTELTVKDGVSIDSQDGKVTVSGATTEITGGNVTSAAGDVDIIGSATNTLSGVSVGGKEVSVTGGSVSVTGGTIDGAAGVKVNGETVFVNNNAAIKANDGDVSLNAGTVNYVDSGTSITAESGGVTIALDPATGAVNIVTGAIVENDIIVSTAPVSITAGGGALVIDGGVSGDNLIDYATMTAAGTAGSITIKGKTNAIGAAVTLQAATGITVSSLGTDALSGNKVDASTLVSAEEDIALDANYANHVSNGTVINAKSGGVKIALTSDSGFANIVSGATDTAPNPVRITAGDGALMIDGDDSGENLVEYATLTAAGTEGRITIQGKANGVGAGATLQADKGVNIISTGTDTDASDSSFDGNLVHASSITAKAGNVAVGAKSINRVIDADLVASAGAVDVSGHTNLVQAESTIQAAGDISVVSTGEEAGSGNYLEHSSLKTSAGSVEISAEQSNVVSNGSTVHANQDIDIISYGTGDNRGNVIQSSTLESDAGDVRLTSANINQVEASKITASGGAVELNGDSNLIYNGVTVQASAGVSMTSSGIDTKDGNQVSNSTVKTSDGDVVMTSNQFNAVINADISTGYMEGKGDIIIGDEDGSTETVTNGIVATEGHKTSIFAGRDVRIAGSNVIMGSNFGAVTIAAAQGDITLRDDNDITCAVIDAAGTDGDVAITTGTGDKGTTITNSGLYGQTVTIAGDTTDRSDDNLAVVTGENTRIASRADAGVGLTLNNVFVRDTEKGNTNIFVKTQSDIAILNRVDLQNGTLTIKQGAASDGRIVVDSGNVLNARAASSLEGRLTGAGDINKSGGDSLLLDYDHSEFTGSIYANGAVGGGNGSLVDAPSANAGSWIEISGEGVGAEASIVLKNTDLVISTDKTRIGTLDTTQDSDVNEKSTGDTLLPDGSYTADGNERTDFTTVGSVLEVNKGKAGDVVQASDMKLSDATLIKLDAEVNGSEVKADTINAAGTINASAVTGLNSTSTAAAPSTARVYIRHADLAAASNAAEGARTTIMTGTMASDINEDVLYDVALSDNGTYQRTLQDRNVHLENKGDHVDLVYSKNYRSAAKDAHLNQVADALKELSDSFHHTEGTLASSSDTMKRLVDAFDYTRSEEAALRGLRSVAGTGNVLPRLMQFDSSRRHLSALRQQMEMPVCKYAWKGALNRTNNVWMSYTGAYDNLSGDSNMGDYSRNAHGAIVGVDRSLSCKLRVGLSLGYETSTGKADASKVDADTFFVDAYATGVTGQLKHRASVGLAASSFEYDRNVLVEAGYHTFNDLIKGETDGLTLNFGYELSSDYHFTERSRMTRYLAVNLAWHQLDSVKEDGLGAVGLKTEFEDEWQADLALGVNYIREFAALRNQKLASFYANAAVHLELLNDRVTANNRLGDTGAGWQTSSMERSPLYFELGAGVVVPLSPTWTGTVGATFEIGPDRYGFSGGVGARYSF